MRSRGYRRPNLASPPRAFASMLARQIRYDSRTSKMVSPNGDECALPNRSNE
jgi:hypothetical protein